jgi:hypothetical protein
VPAVGLLVDFFVEEVLMMGKVEHLANKRKNLRKIFNGFRVLRM